MREMPNWNRRAEKYGHTGHSEPFYYCFDQQARIFAIDQIINSLDGAKNKALDFGCGSGDFLVNLKTRYNSVLGYDSSFSVISLNKHKHNSENILTTSNLSEIESNYNLILAVTVLQNCTPVQLTETLSYISGILDTNGFLLCLEVFLSLDLAHKLKSEKASQVDWEVALQKNNLEVVKVYNFYNPIVRPSKSWKIYERSLFLKLLRLFKQSTFIQDYFSQTAKKLIYKNKDVLLEEKSEFPIYLIRKK